MARARQPAGRRPMLISYGGGHAQIIAALAGELGRRGRTVDVLGLTTAEAIFRREGLQPFAVDALIDPKWPSAVIERAGALAPPADHPDITDAQTRAYFTVGYGDLVTRFGDLEADQRVAEFGRKAFEPISAFVRLFEACRPTVVVATTSPRFELAALKAARLLGIPSIAVGDMYLIAELEWILGGDYADHLTVISADVAEMIARSGRATSQLHVLGNPAFDAHAPGPDDAVVRAAERIRLGVGEKTCLLWPLGGAAVPVAGRALLTAPEAGAFLDDLCDRDPSLTYVLRPHPNWPVGELALRHGVVDASSSLTAALLACDAVCVEASTVGLQAVLMGKPVICYNFADYVLYPDFGWAGKADTLDELAQTVLSRAFVYPPADLRETVGKATARVTDLIEAVELAK